MRKSKPGFRCRQRCLRKLHTRNEALPPHGLPEAVGRFEDILGVILALEPAHANQEAIVLRALKDHDNPDVSELHVALDPKTLLLIRN